MQTFLIIGVVGLDSHHDKDRDTRTFWYSLQYYYVIRLDAEKIRDALAQIAKRPPRSPENLWIATHQCNRVEFGSIGPRESKLFYSPLDQKKLDYLLSRIEK